MATRRLVARIGAVLAACFLTVPALRAEIYEWRDTGGSRHFTNQKELVPEECRSSVRVVVEEIRKTQEAVPSPLVAPNTEPAGVQVVSSRSDWGHAYQAGLRDGIAAAGGTAEAVGGEVRIVGPLAVAGAESVSVAPWAVAEAYPLVTTSFDRGRSRHLTLRMLLQDQFQLDRDGPFLYQRLPPVGLRPNLQPFLPRGLPHDFPRGGRVVVR